MMVRVGFTLVRLDKEARLRDWFKELEGRKPEIRETFRRESVTHEQAFIVASDRGPLLVYVMEAANHELAKAAFQSSQLPIDIQHQEILRECLLESMKVAPVFDCALADDV
jgi:hypothetical protein